MENINIKRATINELSQLQKIGMETFSQTFSVDNDDENMTNYLNESFSLEKLTNELNSEGSEFYFAILENEIT